MVRPWRVLSTFLTICRNAGPDAKLIKELSKEDVERVIIQLLLDGYLVTYVAVCLSAFLLLSKFGQAYSLVFIKSVWFSLKGRVWSHQSDFKTCHRFFLQKEEFQHTPYATNAYIALCPKSSRFTKGEVHYSSIMIYNSHVHFSMAIKSIVLRISCRLYFVPVVFLPLRMSTDLKGEKLEKS